MASTTDRTFGLAISRASSDRPRVESPKYASFRLSCLLRRIKKMFFQRAWAFQLLRFYTKFAFFEAIEIPLITKKSMSLAHKLFNFFAFTFACRLAKIESDETGWNYYLHTVLNITEQNLPFAIRLLNDYRDILKTYPHLILTFAMHL